MKVHGDKAPTGAFSVERVPRTGNALIRFYENPKEFSETENGTTRTGWVYDEYHLELPYRETLAAEVEANMEVFLAAAKAKEAPTEGDRLYALESAMMAMMGVTPNV